MPPRIAVVADLRRSLSEQLGKAPSTKPSPGFVAMHELEEE